MARLIREGGQGTRQVRRPYGRPQEYARAPRWRVRFIVSYPDGSRAIRSKLTARRTEAGLLRAEANRFERLSKTGTATQQDLGHVLRLGLISRDDYLRLGGTQLDVSWNEVLSAYISSSYGRCWYFTHRNNAVRAERVIAFLRARAPVARIGEDDIRAYLASRATEIGKKTLKIELDVARQLLDYPMSRGVLRQPPWNLLMPPNPARRVNGFESPIARTRFPRALSYEEDLQLLALVRDVETASPTLAAAILLLRLYSLRRAELQYLTHADLVGPAVLVQAKAVLPDVLGPGRASASPAGRHRSVIERRETRDQFKDGMWRVKDHEARTIWIPRAGDDPDPRPMQRIRPLLPSKTAGWFILGGHRTLHRDVISQAVERVLHRIDPEFSTHCLRHSFATWLIGRGVNVVRVKGVAGTQPFEDDTGLYAPAAPRRSQGHPRSPMNRSCRRASCWS